MSVHEWRQAIKDGAPHARYSIAYVSALEALVASIPEELILPDGTLRGLAKATCGCTRYEAEMPTSGQCCCGHDEDDHDYHDGWCEALSESTYRLTEPGVGS